MIFYFNKFDSIQLKTTSRAVVGIWNFGLTQTHIALKQKFIVKWLYDLHTKSAFAKLRCAVAPLRIGCFCSDFIEDETHVFLHCPFYDDFTENLFNIA